MYRVSATSITMPISYFVNTGKLILRLIWRGKRPRKANMISKENKVGGLTLSDFETYYKATVIKTVLMVK